MSLICSGAVNEIRVMIEKYSLSKEVITCGLKVLKNVVQSIFLVDEAPADMTIEDFDGVIKSTMSLVVEVMKDNICHGNVCVHCCDAINLSEQGKI